MGRGKSRWAILKKILLHTCCAPCTLYPLRILREEGNEVQGLFYNPNIHPYREYKRRLDTLIAYAEQVSFKLLRDDDSYPFEDFLRQVVFHEDDRCRYCYRIRLSRAARTAREHDFDAFSTTLLYSRYQKHDLIRQIAEEEAKKQGVAFLYRDFREGWLEGVQVSQEMGMYRQPYCGCIYSEKERYYRSPKSKTVKPSV
ncbi:MAG: epoxyqueuosine reductase QueH [Syntrophobacterales bacterium]|nr:epoxyqueuosine reductase QueH [Syntrophobacterales bacterium]